MKSGIHIRKEGLALGGRGLKKQNGILMEGDGEMLAKRRLPLA